MIHCIPIHDLHMSSSYSINSILPNDINIYKNTSTYTSSVHVGVSKNRGEHPKKCMLYNKKFLPKTLCFSMKNGMIWGCGFTQTPTPMFGNNIPCCHNLQTSQFSRQRSPRSSPHVRSIAPWMDSGPSLGTVNPGTMRCTPGPTWAPGKWEIPIWVLNQK